MKVSGIVLDHIWINRITSRFRLSRDNLRFVVVSIIKGLRGSIDCHYLVYLLIRLIYQPVLLSRDLGLILKFALVLTASGSLCSALRHLLDISIYVFHTLFINPSHRARDIG